MASDRGTVDEVIKHEHHVWHLEEENEGCDVSCCEWCNDLRAAAAREREEAYQRGRKEAAMMIRARLTYTVEQQPRFTWHDVEDLATYLSVEPDGGDS